MKSLLRKHEFCAPKHEKFASEHEFFPLSEPEFTELRNFQNNSHHFCHADNAANIAKSSLRNKKHYFLNSVNTVNSENSGSDYINSNFPPQQGAYYGYK
jgi:hypothetical protein